MGHLVEQGMASRFEVFEVLPFLAPATAFIAVVLLRIEVVFRLIGGEEQGAYFHLSRMCAVFRLRVGDSETCPAFTACVVLFGAADGESVGGIRRIIVGRHHAPKTLSLTCIFRTEIMSKAGSIG